MYRLKYLFFIIIILVVAGCTENKNSESKKSKNTSNLFEKKDSLKSFLFVGFVNYNPGIQKYNIEEKRVKKIWGSRRDKVVDLLFKPENEYAYFITAFRYGKEGVFPFVKETQIFVIDRRTEKVKMIDEPGDVIQIFTGWEGDYFKVVYNKFDESDATILYQTKKIYNQFGKVLLEEEKTYDLTKEGYPSPLKNEESSVSNSKVFKINEVKKDTLNFIDVTNLETGNSISLFETKYYLSNVEWNYNDHFVVFSTRFLTPENQTLHKSNPQTSKIFIYSVPEFKLIKKWGEGGIKNFFVHNNLLIFDTGFEIKSEIIIYNMANKKVVQTIKRRNGCGLKNIPEIPDFGA